MSLRSIFSLRARAPGIRTPTIASPSLRAGMQIGFVLVCVAFSLPALLNSQRTPPKNKDYDIWFEVGRRVVEGKGLYSQITVHQYDYMYPPTLAVFLFAPMTMLGYTAFVSIFAAGNAIAWYASFQIGYRLFAGSATRQPAPVFLLPFLASAVFVYDTFLLGQVNVIMLLLMLVMFQKLRAGRPWQAGGALALATAMKAFPLTAVAYLIYRRHWKAAAATVAGLVLILVILPAPIRGFERNADELVGWYRAMLADQSGSSLAQRSDIGFTYKNQSLIAVVHRLTRTLPAGDYDNVPFYVNVFDMTSRQSHLTAMALIGTLSLLYVACLPPRRRQTAASLRCEQAMLLLMMVFCSPLAWTYFFCWTLPAWIVIFHQLLVDLPEASDRRRGWLALSFVGAVMLTGLTQEFDHTAQAVGVTLWGSVGLFLILAWLMRLSVRRGDIQEDSESTGKESHLQPSDL